MVWRSSQGATSARTPPSGTARRRRSFAATLALPGSGDAELARATMRRVSVRLLPLLFALFVCNYVDRANVAIAALQMNRDLRFSAAAYGLGAGIFFVGYALFEVPSNLALARFGARQAAVAGRGARGTPPAAAPQRPAVVAPT